MLGKKDTSQKELRSDAKPGTVLNDDLQRKIKAKGPIARDATLAVDRNRWFIVSIILALLAFYSMYSAHEANQRYENDVRVQWVKMYPNGTWDVEFYDAGEEKTFFPATIDALISQFIERRYSKNKYTIQYDYGFALLFMEKKLKNYFVSREGYNAPQVAADFAVCDDCEEVAVTVKNISHYDAESVQINDKIGTLYRTTVFVEEKRFDRDGAFIGEFDKKVQLSWRVRPKGEIRPSKEELKLNPIGLEIHQAQYLDE